MRAIIIYIAAQRCGHLVISPQLLPQRRRQKHLQLATGAAEVHGEARLERVQQLAEDDAVLVGAELRQRHRGARARAVPRGNSVRLCSFSTLDLYHRGARVERENVEGR